MVRRCLVPTVINGLEFFKDMPIVIDVLGIHYNPDIWGPVDPNKFYPLRYLSNSVKSNILILKILI